MAHEHTGFLGPGFTSNPKSTQWKLPAGRLTPHDLWKTQRVALFPIWLGTQGTLEPSEAWKQRDRIGGKDTHWGSVFLYLTSSSTSLWCSPLSAPSRFPHVYTHAFETPSPIVVSDFCGCCTSCFLACFSCLLCDLPSLKASARLIQLPLYQWAQVFQTGWTCRALYQREWARRERESLSFKE